MEKTAIQQAILLIQSMPDIITREGAINVVTALLPTERAQIEQCYNAAYNVGFEKGANDPSSYFTNTYEQ